MAKKSSFSLNSEVDFKTKVVILLIMAVLGFMFLQKVKADEEAAVDELEAQMMRLEMQALKLKQQIRKLKATPVLCTAEDDEAISALDASDEDLLNEGSEFDVKLPE